MMISIDSAKENFAGLVAVGPSSLKERTMADHLKKSSSLCPYGCGNARIWEKVVIHEDSRRAIAKSRFRPLQHDSKLGLYTDA